MSEKPDGFTPPNGLNLFQDAELTRPADPSTYQWVDGKPHGMRRETTDHNVPGNLNNANVLADIVQAWNHWTVHNHPVDVGEPSYARTEHVDEFLAKARTAIIEAQPWLDRDDDE